MSAGERHSVPRKPPLPLAQAFLVCRAIYEDQRTGEFVLVGPFNGISLNFFPAGFPLGGPHKLYAYHVTGPVTFSKYFFTGPRQQRTAIGHRVAYGNIDHVNIVTGEYFGHECRELID